MPVGRSDSGAVDVSRLLLQHEIEDLLQTEARLLDERRFDEWLDLLTEDVRYWMPLRRNVPFGEEARENSRERQEIAWFDEGKETLAQRVRQLNTGVHWAEEPHSRVCHFVANVQIVSARDDEATVQSRFLIYRNRLEEETDIFVGRREDLVRKLDGQWRIARRTILLDQNVLLAKNLSVLF